MKLKTTDVMILALVTATIALATSVHADSTDQTDPAYYTITSVQTKEIASTQLHQATLATKAAAPSPKLNVVNIGGIDISAIVNIGQQIWNIIEANQPVANVTTSSANAVPQGVVNWEELTGWQAPQTRTYETSFTNGFGMTVIDFQYAISYVPGGNYDGAGQYLANVTVVPQNVTVAWGYKFNAQATVPSITNAGTATDPVAAAEVSVQWTIDTVIKHEQQSAQYYVRGDGAFEAL